MQLIYKYSALILLLTFLQSCGIYKKTDAREFPPEPEKRVAKNIEEGRGRYELGMPYLGNYYRGNSLIIPLLITG